MNKVEQVVKPLEQVGEDIGLAEGTAMVQAYRQANPTDTISHVVGRNILEQILAQPGCSGINIASALKDNGERTLVLIGLDEEYKPILEYTIVDEAGKLDKQHGIVADRNVILKPATVSEEMWEEIYRRIFGL
jgi:hypothetical protein